MPTVLCVASRICWISPCCRSNPLSLFLVHVPSSSAFNLQTGRLDTHSSLVCVLFFQFMPNIWWKLSWIEDGTYPFCEGGIESYLRLCPCWTSFCICISIRKLMLLCYILSEQFVSMEMTCDLNLTCYLAREYKYCIAFIYTFDLFCIDKLPQNWGRPMKLCVPFSNVHLTCLLYITLWITSVCEQLLLL